MLESTEALSLLDVNSKIAALQSLEMNNSEVYQFLAWKKPLRYGDGNSTTAEEVFRFQRLFPNPNWMVCGRDTHHQKLAPIPMGG